jgi:hypothetical protein
MKKYLLVSLLVVSCQTEVTETKSNKCLDSDDCIGGNIKCDLLPDGQCGYASNESCHRSLYCKMSGLCQLHQNKCIAIYKDDCTKSSNCQNFYKCTPKDGVCIK